MWRMNSQDLERTSSHLPTTAEDVGSRLVLQMSRVLVPINPHLETDPASGDTVGGPGPSPHVAEAPAGHGGDAAEVRGSDAAVEIAVICREKDEKQPGWCSGYLHQSRMQRLSS